MPFRLLPIVPKCCGCINDLKTAVAIIAVLGIVTSPVVSWASVRHSYVIRVSCFVTTNAARPDVIDVNLNNILSFGFGANAGLGPSCLSPVSNTTQLKAIFRAKSEPSSSQFISSIKYIGWLVLIADIVLLFSSVYLLIKLSLGADKKAAKIFMISVCVSVLLSFIYSILYISSCISVGGSFPVFEFIFTFIDLFLWIYFLIVVNSYRRQST
ncbi:hypothetical protein K1T71_006635 [Dendrolimus kikuchii]|uniref:Uncharacterized protein n=1 Tax=Dendrolimus kikuchii TaxID=765133 RepID=A0ACC1D2J8_9NEOP|nr:hypothetical protein K1T71_006635 [Dendrolimus kikuchii]